MKLNLFFSYTVVDELFFSDKTVVAIDVLRATSTIITAFENGAGEIIPVASIEFAMKVSGSMFGGKTLLAGERNTLKIDGFNLGNSPLEFSSEAISGKSIILYTTNGTKAIVRTRFSEQTLICAFNNIAAVCDHLCSKGKDVIILCSGRNNLFSLEDTVCGGILAKMIMKNIPGCECDDAVSAAMIIADKHKKDIAGMMKNSEHGKILLQNGFEEDIDYCAKLDVISTVPVFISNLVKGKSL